MISDFKKIHGDRYDYSKVDYKGAPHKVIIICKIHGEFLQLPSNHKSGKNCPKCSSEERMLNLKELQKENQEINPNIKIMEIVRDNVVYLKCSCGICDHIWNTTVGNLSKRCSCPVCAGNKKLILEDVIIRVKNIFPSINILDDVYINSKTKLKCECAVCGNLWTASFDNLRGGHGCPVCARVGIKNKFHNKKIAEYKKDEWLDTPATVYIIKCWNETESFFKIGLTTKTIQERFKSSIPYEFEIIFELKTNLYDAIKIEDELHYSNSSKNYMPKVKFNGYTECFSEINIQKSYCNLINGMLY